MKTFYFVSTKPIKILIPRIPYNFLTENGYEDDKIKRICVSTDIGKCLTALSYSLNNEIFYVYKIKTDKYVKPDLKQVPDVNITDEYWILDSIVPTLYCKIKVKDAVKSDKKLIYKYGNEEAEIYEWNYDIIKFY